MTVKEFIEPMYQMAISIQACDQYAKRDFPNETYARNRYYCHRKRVSELKTEEEFEKILNYHIGCVVQKGDEIVIQVGE